jgi:cytochrome c oxidase subunit 4
MPHHHVRYVLVFVYLVVLTVVTVLVAMHRFESEAINVILALIVASIKASLVAMFFMHLKFEGKLIYTIAIVPLVLCVILCVALIPDIIHGHLYHDITNNFLHLFHHAPTSITEG